MVTKMRARGRRHANISTYDRESKYDRLAEYFSIPRTGNAEDPESSRTTSRFWDEQIRGTIGARTTMFTRTPREPRRVQQLAVHFWTAIALTNDAGIEREGFVPTKVAASVAYFTRDR